MEFIHTNDGFIMHQHKYIKELLDAYFIHSSNHVTSPLPSKLKPLYNKENPLLDPTEYRQLRRKLNFLLHTRPDIAITVQFLSQFNSSPCQNHRDAAINVFVLLAKYNS